MGKTAKVTALLLLTIFLTLLLALSVPPVSAQTKTLTVPDQYPTIQSAIGNASSGDTIFVRKGTYDSYLDAIIVDKPINLVGEDSKQTIINGHRSDDGSYPIPYNRPTISISCANVVISGFSITNSFYAVTVQANASEIKIVNNIISNSSIGIDTERLITNSEISRNVITDSTNGISGYLQNSIIANNTLFGNVRAIYADESINLTINENNIINNDYGILLQSTSNAHVYGNQIVGSKGLTTSPAVEHYGWTDQPGYGVELFLCNDSILRNNALKENDIGIYLPNYLLRYGQGLSNQVYSNNFINNSDNAVIEHQYPFPEAYKELQTEYKVPFNGTDNVSWDNGTVGNYWSDYTGNGSYVIDENDIDHHPLFQPVDTSSTTNPASNQPDTGLVLLIAATIMAVAIVSSLLLYRRHRKTIIVRKI
jgi:parallel beta-helix repeat protein